MFLSLLIMMLSEIYCTDTLTLYHSAQHFVILVPSVCYLVCSTVSADWLVCQMVYRKTTELIYTKLNWRIWDLNPAPEMEPHIFSTEVAQWCLKPKRRSALRYYRLLSTEPANSQFISQLTWMEIQWFNNATLLDLQERIVQIMTVKWVILHFAQNKFIHHFTDASFTLLALEENSFWSTEHQVTMWLRCDEWFKWKDEC